MLNEEYYAEFFSEISDSVGYIFERNKIMTVFEIYLMELFTVFKQKGMESPLSLLDTADNHSYNTRRSKNGLIYILQSESH